MEIKTICVFISRLPIILLGKTQIDLIRVTTDNEIIYILMETT